LKSASALVGGDEISAAAYELEMAGSRNDLDFIRAHNDEFIENVKALLNNIHSAIS
jgi:hypothetical protein